MFPPTLVIDAGNHANIGWARSAHDDGCTLGESGDADTLAEAIDWLAAMLRRTSRGTIGIEAPLWTPRRDDVRRVTAAPMGEGDRPWTASAGACATTAGLGDMGFIFGRLARVPATVRPEKWARDGGLLVWEAFISSGKGEGHSADALVALHSFERRMQSFDARTLRSDLTPEPAVNLAVACALAAGVLIDVAEIGDPAVVVKARKGDDLEADRPIAQCAPSSPNPQEDRSMKRNMGWDAQAIHTLARDKYGGLRQMFVAHGWPERGPKMMIVVQRRVKQTYGSVGRLNAPNIPKRMRGNDNINAPHPTTNAPLAYAWAYSRGRTSERRGARAAPPEAPRTRETPGSYGTLAVRQREHSAAPHREKTIASHLPS